MRLLLAALLAGISIDLLGPAVEDGGGNRTCKQLTPTYWYCWYGAEGA